MLNKRIVQEMLYSKSNKSLNKMINTEIFGIIVILLAIPLCIWLYIYRFENLITPKILFAVCIAVSIIGIILGIYSLKKYLLKIDFSKNVKVNMHYVNNYAIYYRKGKIINYSVIIPVFSILGILCYYEIKAPFYLWIFLFCALTIGVIITYWLYKKIYDANIESIKKSLEELNELKEE